MNPGPSPEPDTGQIERITEAAQMRRRQGDEAVGLASGGETMGRVWVIPELLGRQTTEEA